jgi:hypothetical protein
VSILTLRLDALEGVGSASESPPSKSINRRHS